jgi:hypothetical protein
MAQLVISSPSDDDSWSDDDDAAYPPPGSRLSTGIQQKQTQNASSSSSLDIAVDKSAKRKSAPPASSSSSAASQAAAAPKSGTNLSQKIILRMTYECNGLPNVASISCPVCGISLDNLTEYAANMCVIVHFGFAKALIRLELTFEFFFLVPATLRIV